MIFAYYPANLLSYLKDNKNKLSINDYRKIFSGLLKGVDYLHKSGVSAESNPRSSTET